MIAISIGTNATSFRNTESGMRNKMPMENWKHDQAQILLSSDGKYHAFTAVNTSKSEILADDLQMIAFPTR